MSISEMDESATPDAPAAAAAAAPKADETTAALATSSDTPSAPAPPAAAPLKSEEAATPAASDDEKDEEDEFFNQLEEKQHVDELAHAGDVQPHNAAAAPTLLRKAIEEGKVGVDESEAESEEGHKKEAAVEGDGSKVGEEEKKEEPHVHHRVSKRVRHTLAYVVVLVVGGGYRLLGEAQ